MQNISIHMLIDNIQAKDFVKFDIMKIMIHLAWVPNSMVIFSASYLTKADQREKLIKKTMPSPRRPSPNSARR